MRSRSGSSAAAIKQEGGFLQERRKFPNLRFCKCRKLIRGSERPTADYRGDDEQLNR